jgi:signal transduction histidine kinase
VTSSSFWSSHSFAFEHTLTAFYKYHAVESDKHPGGRNVRLNFKKSAFSTDFSSATKRFRKHVTATKMSKRVNDNQVTDRSPFPIMPSQTFLDLAYSQFELLTNALLHSTTTRGNTEEHESKIKSIALYLPQENSKTGQLEFLPSAVFPSHPKSERVFIASDANSGLPPTVPPTLTQLPGFAHAATIIPTYPFASATTDAGGVSAVVGTPEEVLCDRRLGSETGSATSTALSMPLFSGPQTIGVLLIWGEQRKKHEQRHSGSENETVDGDIANIWTEKDMAQIRRTGETLAMALCLDADRHQNQIKSEEFRVAIADNLHQVKNPVQALRTFTKLLQRNMATDGDYGNIKLGRLVDDMVLQSDRIAQNLKPIDAMIDAMENSDNEMSYQRLLAPIDRENRAFLRSQQSSSGNSSFDVHPKLMPTSSYLVQLSASSSSTSSSSQPTKPESKMRKIYQSDEDQMQIGFIPDVLQPVISASEAIAADSGIEFRIHGMNDDTELPGVTVRPKALQEAVSNILDNAIKYVSLGRDGEWGVENLNPLIRISLQPNDDGIPRGVTILVEDNGPGISFAERDSVFERGYRGEKARSLSHGSGIGMEYSRLMIARMGGDISLLVNSNCYLRGTVIKFVLYRKIDKL